MAEIPYGGDMSAPVPTAPGAGAIQTLGTLTNWAGAAVSLALIVGIGVWGYRMIMRDVSGVPVVRAASDAPMRVAPENPGGEAALHQGLAVNRVAAMGAAERPADRLILAPAPVSLTADDLPRGAIEQALAEAVVEPEDAGAPAQMGSIQALAEQLAAGALPLDTTGAVIGDEAADGVETVQTVAAVAPADVADNPVPAPAVKGGIKASLRPMVRPGGLRQAVVTAAAAAAPGTEALELAPDAVAAGSHLAQLGAFDSPETARREWDKLATRFEDYLSGKQRVIQKASSGGRIFYRLRAVGFADMNDARRFCSALVAERADCIPVTAK